MNSKSSTYEIYRDIPLHQTNEDETKPAVYRFANECLAIATDNSQYAELSGPTLRQCSGTNRIMLCRKSFSTTTDETLLCLTALFYTYDILALGSCKVESVFLPEAPQAIYLADCLYHVVSQIPTIQLKNDTTGLPLVITTFWF